MIECQELTRNYGSLRAVDAVSFHVDRGEIVGLLGHNGAGKTTIMKMMTGYLEPTAGRVLLGGSDIGDQRQELQMRLGYLPENSPVYPEMSIIAYLDYVAALRGVAVGGRASLINEAMERTGIVERATQSISTLSRGFRQRVGVAQAILHKPDIVILDEPTNGLDPSQIQEMRSLIAELGRSSTVILSTHILQEVEASCERVLIVVNGKLALDSRISDLKHGGGLRMTALGAASGIASTLRQIPQITSFEELSAGDEHCEFRLDVSVTDAARRSELLGIMIQRGLKVTSFSLEQQNLEAVFREVNTQPSALSQ